MPAPTSAFARAYVGKYKLAVVRIEPGLKYPRHEQWNQPGGWFTTSEEAEAFYAEKPDWGMGVVLGPSQLCSLDVDNVIETKQVLSEFGIDIDQYARDFPTIVGNPARFRVEFSVPEGVILGRHALQWPNQDDPEKHHAVFELRAGDVQDVFPPSIHPGTKQPYTWLTKPNGHFPEIPAALLAIWKNWDIFVKDGRGMCPWSTSKPPAMRAAPLPPVEFDGQSVIGAFNEAHDIDAILQRYGYVVVGRRWLSPHSSTGLPGVVRLDDKRVYVHHASDPLFSDPPHPIGPFDVFKEYEHHGDVREAVKAAAKLLGMHRGTKDKPAAYKEPKEPSKAVVEVREKTLSELEAEIQKLAQLSVAEFEPIRRETATRLNIRTAVLDKLIEDARQANQMPDEQLIPIEQQSHFATWMALGLDMTKNGPVCNLNTATKCILGSEHIAGHIWFDEFSKKIYTDLFSGVHEWADYDTIQLTLALQHSLGLVRMTSMQVREALIYVARQNIRNAPKEYMDSLVWDGKTRLASLLYMGWGAPLDDYHGAVGRCWMTSLVARVYTPGCKVDTVPVFEGSQGLFKSTALSIIGGDWYDECHEQALSKDFFMILEGKLIIEVAEMHTFSAAEVRRVKGIISCRVDRYRAPYASEVSNHPRQAVLACTTNEDDWNRDPTGARRFWPIACGEINLDYLTGSRDQLFAEAVSLYKMGNKWWDVPEAEAKAQQEQRRLSDVWEEKIAEWCIGMGKFTTLDVMERCLMLDSKDQRRDVQVRISGTLRALGFGQIMDREGTKRIRRWAKPP